ncbi:MAG: Hpt domain-containing protein [Planctomycetota bacterium]|nr:Hpt domain-containing protein [Planctomycetota bacterium]
MEDFVDDLPVRATRVHDHLVAGQLPDAADELHQLKGAAGIYGFKPIYEAANQLEERVNDQQDGIVETAIDLIALCKRATSEAEPA